MYRVLLKLIPSKTISIIFPLIKIAIHEYKTISISLKTKKLAEIIITSIIIIKLLALNLFEILLIRLTNKSVPPVELLDLKIRPSPIPY